METLKISISWSGGFDSTALLLYYLNLGYEVELCSVKITNNEAQIKAEESARSAILAELKKLSLLTDWPSGPRSAKTQTGEIGLNLGHTSGLTQPPIWAMCVAQLATNTEIAFGYIHKDDFWSIKSEFCEMVRLTGICRDVEHKALFPFKTCTKEDLLGYYNNCPSVLKLVSTCEMGGALESCDCYKCTELRKTLKIEQVCKCAVTSEVKECAVLDPNQPVMAVAN